jgi:essential nuclear protein 1
MTIRVIEKKKLTYAESCCSSGKEEFKSYDRKVCWTYSFDRPLFRRKCETPSDSDTEKVVPVNITQKILRVARDQLEEESLARDTCSETSDDSFVEYTSDADDDVDQYGGEKYDEDEEEMQREYATKLNRVVEENHSKESEDLSAMDGVTDEILAHYTRIGKFLSTYTTGKIPKGFKVLPTRKQWEELLYYTNPVEWTPHAHYQAAKIFASNLNDNLAQRYFNLVLLPAIRVDIKENKKLHFQLYQALKKALFKPLAFMKGILLPLSDARDCTLKEAVIIGSVLAKMTVPMAFGAAGLYKLAVKQENWIPVKSVLITMLLNKKYSLPTQVLEGLVAHFESFKLADSGSKLPVLWHNSLLTFVQRYKGSLDESQRNRFLELLKVHTHHMITPEVRRELTVMEM